LQGWKVFIIGGVPQVREHSSENRNFGEMKEIKELKGISLSSFISLSSLDFHLLDNYTQKPGVPRESVAASPVLEI
jgi:hypothetical protein